MFVSKSALASKHLKFFSYRKLIMQKFRLDPNLGQWKRGKNKKKSLFKKET
jgi:hypothetical protein